MELDKKQRKQNNIFLLASIVIVLWLCIAQVSGSTLLIVLCLMSYLGLTVWGAFRNMAFPLLLFFLPWSTLLKVQQETMSFFSIALILVCLICWFKNRFKIKSYHIIPAIFLVVFTFLSRFADRNLVDNSYILFVLFICLFPMLSKEIGKSYNFYYLVVFFSIGIVLAALTAQQLMEYPNIAEYIDVYTHKTITRLSGYYGDPNFYSAHITAALSGVLLLIIKEKNVKKIVFILLAAVLLMYCGLLSASKTFMVVIVCILLFWFVELFAMRGKVSFKITILFTILIIGIYVLSSTVFSELIDVMIIRFNQNTDMSALTTGRTDIWEDYFEVFSSEIKVLLFGKGFTNVLVDGSASHNTLIQTVYQFGIIGTPIFIAWIYCFARKILKGCKLNKRSLLRIFILVMGILGPWLSLDMLFFDEIFLMQMFLYVAIRWVCTKDDNGQQNVMRLQESGDNECILVNDVRPKIKKI